MRKYQEIWEKIKAAPKKELSITAPIKFHKRIRKAVYKEKDEDGGFKLEMLEKQKRAVLLGTTLRIDNKETPVLQFKLTISPSIKAL